MELESALLIIAPKPVQAFAYTLREAYDPVSFAKVPAHFTLFYPFLPADQSDEAAKVLGDICSRFSPFDVTLDHYGHFDDAVFLEPTDSEPFRALYAALAETYPDYARQDYHPHLTLARSDDPDQIPLPDPPSFTFPVDKIHIYVGAPEDHIAPYIPRAAIPLG